MCNIATRFLSTGIPFRQSKWLRILNREFPCLGEVCMVKHFVIVKLVIPFRAEDGFFFDYGAGLG